MVNVLYQLVIQKIDSNFYKAIEIKNFEDENFKCIVLGNSLTLDGIDTEYLTNKGISSYNFALAGSTLKSNYIQLNHYISYNSKPKIVLLGLGSSLKNYGNIKSSNAIHPIIDFCYGGFKERFDNLPMIKFKWLATENLKKLVSKQHREAKLVLGQLRIRRKVPDQTKYRAKLKQEITFDDYKGAKYMFKIDSICKSNNIKLVIVEMPGYKNTRNEVPVGPNLITNKDDSLYIYNLNNKILCDSLFDPENDWLGNSHLNQYGAKKLTKYIYKNVLLD